MLRKIDAMHSLFGIVGDATCKICPHIRGNWAGNRHVYKCEAYGDTASEATDWRLWYPACNLIFVNLKKDYVPVIERIKHGARGSHGEPIPGQMTMFEEDNHA